VVCILLLIPILLPPKKKMYRHVKGVSNIERV